MSDNEASDDMEELQEIIREYAEKAKRKAPKSDEKGEISTPNADQQDAPAPSSLTKQPIEWIKSEEEVRLEKLIFGNKAGLLENLKKSSGTYQEEENSEQTRAKKRKPAWHDADDDDLQLGEVKRENKHTGPMDHLQKDKPYKEYLKSSFERIVAAPKWADLDRVEEPDSDEEILRTVGFIDHTKSATLTPNDIQFKKLKDLNRATYAEGPISSIDFHPTSTVAMVSGLNCIATLYSIDGLKNEKLHSIRFPDFPIKCATILPNGTEAMFASKCKYYYSYDLMKATEIKHRLPNHIHRMANFVVSPCGKYFAANGRFGELHLYDVKSKEFIHTFHQEEPCRAVKFSLDSSKIITSCRGSTISIFDLRRQRMMHSFTDDGCIMGRALAISPDGKMFATGSAEGAVNIYNYDTIFTSKTPQPEKSILNLTTAITQLKFNHTSEILAMCSDIVPAAVKLVHFPTGTVFANFPGFKTKLPCIRAIEFSPSSGFLAMGSKVKEAPLYRLKHFNNY